jgi:HEAT repeat protein
MRRFSTMQGRRTEGLDLRRKLRHYAAMRKRVHIVLAVPLVAIVGATVWRVLCPPAREPVYEGKRLSFWLREAGAQNRAFSLVSDEASNRVTSARAAVRQIGTNGIPTLLRLLAKKDSFAVGKLVDFWDRHRYSLPAWVRYPGWYRNQAAALNADAVIGFEILRADAQQAVPALIRLYEQNVSPQSQAATSRSLNALGPAAQRLAVPVFSRAAGSSNVVERNAAVWALSEVDAERADPKQVLPALIKALGDTNFVIRIVAARSLARFGTNAADAVPALLRLLSDPNPRVRPDATNALRKIKPEAVAGTGVD